MPTSPALTRLSSGHYNTGDWNATTNQGGMGGDGHRQALVPPKPPQTGSYPVLTSDIVAVAAEVAADAQAAATASQAAESLAGTAITGLSTSALTISTGTLTLLTQTQKAWVPGMRLRIGQVMAPNVDFMDAQVTSYDATSGALTASVTAVGGSGTYASWSLRPLAAATQAQFDAREASDLMVAPSHLAMGAELHGGTLTAAATLLLPAVGTDFDVAGATTITAISSRPRGRLINLTFASDVTLAHSSTLKMPDGIDLSVPAGGTLTLRALSAGWQVTSQNIRRATTGTHGTARLATQSILDTRTSSTDAVTPALLAHGLGLTGTSVAAASTLTLPAVGDDFAVTGSGATITGISARTPAGRVVRLKLAGANTLVHSAALSLFTSANIATEAGDIIHWKSTAAGWEMIGYERASGRALVGSGTLLRIVTFTSSATWTKGTGTRCIKVRGVAGGGSGPGGRPSSYASGGGGGGAGGYFEKLIDVSALASVPVTIGAGGAQQTTDNANGNDGGGTSFGSYASATGGQGGRSNMTTPAGGLGGVATGGDVNIDGAAGGRGDRPFGTNGFPGRGASSMLGFGGEVGSGEPTGYGAGGGGADGVTPGQAGRAGVIIVEEFA